MGIGEEGDVFFGEVDAYFDEGESLGKKVDGGCQTAGQLAGQELTGGAKLGLALGGDGGGHAFGLGEVEAAIEISAGGELAGVGGASAKGVQLIEEHAGKVRVAGEVKLNEIIAGVTARGVEGIEPARDAKAGEMECDARGSAWGSCRHARQWLGDRMRVRAAEADDDAGGAGGGAGDGRDGVGGVHVFRMPFS